MDSKLIDKLIEQQEQIKVMQENEDSAIKIMKMYEDCKKKINKVIADIEDLRDKNNYYDDYKVDNSILTYWIDLLKGEDRE